MSKVMLINVLQPEECRIAILENGVLEELYVERTSHESYVNNIYKGRIVNIEPSIQAAFVDFGVGRNGFLHVSDVEPAYFRHLEQRRDGGRDRDRRGGRDRNRDRDRDRRGGRDRDRAERERDVARAYGDIEFEEEERPLTYGEPEVEEPTTEETEVAAEPTEDQPWGRWEEELAEAETPAAELEEDITVAEPPPQGDPLSRVPRPVEEQPETIAEERHPAPLLPEPEAPAAGVMDATVPEMVPVEEEPAKETKRKRATRPRKEKEEKTSRSTTRKRKTKASAEAEGGSEESEAAPAEPEHPRESEEPSAEEPKPRLMDSAERRTDEEDGEGDGEERLDNGSASESGPGSLSEDEDLFFPRSRREADEGPAAEPESRHESPAPEPEIAPPEHAESSAAEVPPHETAHRESAPRERGGRDRDRDRGRRGDRGGRGDRGERGGRGRRAGRGAIEDELEADLRAAEVETEPAERRDEPAEFEREESPPEEGWEELEPHPAYEDLDEDFAPPTPGPRRDQERERDRGRDRDEGGRPRGRGHRDRDRRRGGPGGGGRGNGRPKPNIQDIFKRGQEVIVQVIKEGLGSKGPTLSTYISIAGRYLVLMPGLNRVGVSKKINDEEQRRRLRDMFHDLKPPKGLGFIIRTACEDKNKKELQRDLAYLSRLWQVVVRRIRRQKAPCEIYQESDRITRTLRDAFTGDIDTIIVDEPNAFEEAREFLQIVMPRYADRIQLYTGTEPLFHKYGVEAEMDRIQQRKVPLPNGGSIVIEQTEALVAIDVNSGNFRADNNAEETAYQINLVAAKEIARQLRLRDLGGVIVNDFIDMREEKHRRAVEKALRDAVKRDRARTKVLKMSAFGIIEMTRQRIRPSLKRSVYEECVGCKGTGHVKTPESMSLEVIRLLQLAAHREYIRRIEVRVTEAVANYLHNRKRKEINELEEKGRLQVQITGLLGAPPETLDFFCFDNNDNEVRLFPIEEQRRPARR